MRFFDIDNIFFVAFGYAVSYLEFIGVVFGLLAVWYSAREKVISWPLGIINVVLAFFLVFQVQLYPDMFLQVFFFITNLLGWWRWTHPLQGESDEKMQLKISYMPLKSLFLFSAIVLTGTVAMGSFSSHLHELLPSLFSQPSAFPYIDSFVTVMSIVATYLMVQKKVECWPVWITLDVVAAGMYLVKGLLFYSLEYAVFCFLAGYGFWNWAREYRLHSAKVV